MLKKGTCWHPQNPCPIIIAAKNFGIHSFTPLASHHRQRGFARPASTGSHGSNDVENFHKKETRAQIYLSAHITMVIHIQGNLPAPLNCAP